MARRELTRLLGCAAVMMLLAALAASASLAQPATMYCVNGASTTLPVTLTFAGGSRVLTEATAENVIANSFDNTTFYLGFTTGGLGPFFFIPDATFDPDTSLQPGYSTNTVMRGACSAASVSLDRNFWLCYSPFQTDPAVFARTESIANYTAGMTVPFAVREPLSNTRLASGLYLVCNLPAGHTVQDGVAVSTGAGEILSGPPELVSFVLGSMPLDYTRLVARVP